MTLGEFKDTLSKSRPPAGLAPALAALWWAGNDKWDKAHAIVMDEGGNHCAWVEGDLGNAGYWYRQAQRPVATQSIAAEWDAIAKALLKAQQ